MRLWRISVQTRQRAAWTVPYLPLDSEIVDLATTRDDRGREYVCALTRAGYHWHVRRTFGLMWAWRTWRDHPTHTTKRACGATFTT